MASTTANGRVAFYDREPDVCPVCHHAVAPREIQAVFAATDGDRETLEIAFQCTLKSCSHMFIGVYHGPKKGGQYNLQMAIPRNVSPPVLPDEVKEVSSQFVIIFTQSAAAEDYGLDEVAGVGYRKALEFLIKDFCAKQNPSEAEQIKEQFLGAVIDKYVDNQNIKSCAKRATWLGNDETHYVRKWGKKDISDLKILIQLTVGWIRDHILTQKYLTEMK